MCKCGSIQRGFPSWAVSCCAHTWMQRRIAGRGEMPRLSPKGRVCEAREGGTQTPPAAPSPLPSTCLCLQCWFFMPCFCSFCKDKCLIVFLRTYSRLFSLLILFLVSCVFTYFFLSDVYFLFELYLKWMSLISASLFIFSDFIWVLEEKYIYYDSNFYTPLCLHHCQREVVGVFSVAASQAF